jgi:hypothetical protein
VRNKNADLPSTTELITLAVKLRIGAVATSSRDFQ